MKLIRPQNICRQLRKSALNKAQQQALKLWVGNHAEILKEAVIVPYTIERTQTPPKWYRIEYIWATAYAEKNLICISLIWLMQSLMRISCHWGNYPCALQYSKKSCKQALSETSMLWSQTQCPPPLAKLVYKPLFLDVVKYSHMHNLFLSSLSVVK